MPLPSFIFDGNSNTPDELARRRALAMALLQNGSTGVANNLGQGIAQFGQALAGRMKLSGVNRDEAKARNSAYQGLGGLFGGAPSPAPAAGSAPMAGGGGNIEGRLTGDLVKRLGVSPAVAAGIVGNLSTETGGFKHMQELNPTVKGSRGGFGYAQWTGPRRKAFEAWSAQNGLDPTSYDANLGYLTHELTATPESRVMASLKTAQDPATAARIFSEQFLRPGIPHMDSRIANAQRIAGMTPTPQPSPSPMGSQQAGMSSPFVPSMPPPAQMASAAPQIAPASGPAPMPQLTGQQMAQLRILGRNVPEGTPEYRAAAARITGQGRSQGGGGGIFANIFGGGTPQASAPQGASPPMAPAGGQAQVGGQGGNKLADLQNFIMSGKMDFVSPAAQKMVMDEYQNELAKSQPPDPMQELQRRKLEAEVKGLENPQPKPGYRSASEAEKKAAGIDPSIPVQIGPDGKIDPISIPGAKDSKPAGIQEYEYAKSQGFPGTFQDWEASKKGGMSLSVDPTTGQVTFQQGSNIKPMTEAQGKDTVFATRAEGALANLEKNPNALTEMGSSVGGSIPIVGNYLKSNAYSTAEQAGKEFLAAILRKDSGAVIGKEEMDNYGAMYLPQPGNSADLLIQKKEARKRALEALKAGMTPQAILAQEQALQKSGNTPALPPPPAPNTPETNATPVAPSAGFDLGESDIPEGAQVMGEDGNRYWKRNGKLFKNSGKGWEQAN